MKDAIKILIACIVYYTIAEGICWLFPTVDRGRIFFILGTCYGIYTTKEKPRTNAA